MWKIIGSAIGGFFASIFGSWFRERSVRRAEDQKVAGQEAEQTIRTVEKAHEAQVEFDTGHVPADVADCVRAQYID